MTVAVGPSPGRVVAGAYDALAATYDQQVVEDAWMRRHLWRRCDRWFVPGQHVLDLACGTGLDTLYLASRGVRVTAIDVSPAMTGRLLDKLRDHPARRQVEVLTMDLAELDQLDGPSFDGVVSTFAGLNTVPDLERLACHLARLLRPGARGLLHLLAPAGLWRCLRHLRRHGLAAAVAERRRRERRLIVDGRELVHRVLDLDTTCVAVGRHLRVVHACSVGVLWPRTWGRRLTDIGTGTGAGRRLAAVDAAAGSVWPLRGWGRFLVLEVERR